MSHVVYLLFILLSFQVGNIFITLLPININKSRKFSAKYLEFPEILLTFAADYQGVLPVGG